MKKFFDKLLHPKGWALFLIYIFSAIFIAGSLAILFVDYVGTPLEISAYVLFVLAAVSLAYTVYTIVIYAPGLKGRAVNRIRCHPLGDRVISDWGFRTVISAGISFIFGVANALVNAVVGITSHSIWFGALAAYYILITFLRGGLIVGSRRKVRGEALRRAQNYMGAGCILLILNIALSSAIAQMIFDNRAFEYRDGLVFVLATYAFYKITMAIINAVKAQKYDDLTVQGIRNINLVDGAVSILALQTTLLNTFGEEGLDISLFNTLTGSAVSLFSVALSIFMIVKGNKAIKEIKNGKQ